MAYLLPKHIDIDFIPQSEQRYDTLGDYGTHENGNWWFKITRAEDLQHLAPLIIGFIRAMAIVQHELGEKTFCLQDGVKDEDIDAFDMGSSCDDPGWHPLAPYNAQHQKGDVLERTMIAFGGDSWTEYEQAITDLFD